MTYRTSITRVMTQKYDVRHISAIDIETLRGTVEYTITLFKHGIDANLIPIELIFK